MSEVARKPEKCRHFCGIQKVCGAGINPRTLRDTSGKGMARWPCLTLVGYPPATTVCDKREPMTPEDWATEERDTKAAVDAFIGRLAAGNCPHCNTPIASRKRVGRCEYAQPCGHRIGQVGDEVEP